MRLAIGQNQPSTALPTFREVTPPSSTTFYHIRPPRRTPPLPPLPTTTPRMKSSHPSRSSSLQFNMCSRIFIKFFYFGLVVFRFKCNSIQPIVYDNFFECFHGTLLSGLHYKMHLARSQISTSSCQFFIP